jgi:glutathione S-transferase
VILYRCKTPTDRLCPCGKVARELKAAGHEFEERRVPLSRKAEARPEIVSLTGQPLVPVLVEDDGTATHDSGRIARRIKSTSAVSA